MQTTVGGVNLINYRIFLETTNLNAYHSYTPHNRAFVQTLPTEKGAIVTQYEKILQYIDDFGSISPMEAFSDLGITKLSTRIGEMIESGISIEKHREKGRNRFGEKVNYMRYTKGE